MRALFWLRIKAFISFQIFLAIKHIRVLVMFIVFSAAAAVLKPMLNDNYGLAELMIPAARSSCIAFLMYILFVFCISIITHIIGLFMKDIRREYWHCKTYEEMLSVYKKLDSTVKINSTSRR